MGSFAVLSSRSRSESSISPSTGGSTKDPTLSNSPSSITENEDRPEKTVSDVLRRKFLESMGGN